MHKNQIPLVFLHGFLGTSQDWLSVQAFLSSYPCYAIDLPGHGNIGFTPDFASIIPPFPKMHLIGYSMGGRLAMQYAEKFPEKIATLTIFSAHLGLASSKERMQRRLQDHLWAEKIVQNFDDFLAEWYDQPIFAGFKPDFTVRKKQNPEELAKSLIHYSLGNQKLMKPKNALFAVGEKDQKYRKLYPKAPIIPKSGHMVHLENPKAVAMMIEKRINI